MSSGVYHGGLSISSGLTLSTNVPYFIGVSCRSGSQNFVVVNLATGQVQTATTTTVRAFSAATGYTIGGLSGGSKQADATIMAAMHSVSYLSLPELLAWAADPWAFWYPAETSAFDQIIAALSSSSVLALLALSQAGFAAQASATGAAALAAFTRARAGAQAAQSLAASIAARSSARARSRGLFGSGAFFSATAAAAARFASRGGASLASAFAARSAMGAKGRSASAQSVAMAARSRAAVMARATAAAATNLYAASGASRAIASARAAISTASSGIVINPNLLLKAPATIRSLSATATTRVLKAVQTIRKLKAPP